MANKEKSPKFSIWIRRVHSFTAEIKAVSFEQALEAARNRTIDELLDAPGETIDSEHEVISVHKV